MVDIDFWREFQILAPKRKSDVLCTFRVRLFPLVSCLAGSLRHVQWLFSHASWEHAHHFQCLSTLSHFSHPNSKDTEMKWIWRFPILPSLGWTKIICRNQKDIRNLQSAVAAFNGCMSLCKFDLAGELLASFLENGTSARACWQISRSWQSTLAVGASPVSKQVGQFFRKASSSETRSHHRRGRPFNPRVCFP